MSFTVPIVINNFNRLTTTKRLADDLKTLGYNKIIILDNSSTYPPLLKWYDECLYEVIRFPVNYGELALYNSDVINRFPSGSWVGYTDSDIQLNSNTPPDFIEKMMYLAAGHLISKVGLALEIGDIPGDIDYRINVKNWEKKYWEKEIEKDVYLAEIDTTFCIVRAGMSFQYEALRVGGNFTCKHLPWYQDFNNLDEEEEYYMKHASNRSNYRKIYDQWKEKNQ